MKHTLTIGVDIGGTRTKYGLVDITTGEVIDSVVQPTEISDAQQFLRQVGSATTHFMDIARQRRMEITGIGFGIPGFTTEDGTVLTTYGFLKFMENYPLKALIEETFQLPCLVDNDARIVCLGEALYGKGREYNRVLALTLGTGVGLGFVVNRQFTDVLPMAHMGGHVKITDDGEVCYCGERGDLESLVCSTGISKMAADAGMKDAETTETIFEAGLKQDMNAVRVINQLIEYLHTGIYNYVNLFAPDIVVLGGGVAKGLLPYLEEIKGASYMGPYPGYDFVLEVSQLQEAAGMLGAAALFTRLNNHS